MFVKLSSCEYFSTLTVAPTGDAADNCGGDTSNLALLLNRNHKTYQPFSSKNQDNCKQLQDKMETLEFCINQNNI